MGVRLIDLEPRWINNQAAGRHGIGVSFQCMLNHCCGRIRVLFDNPLDGGPPWPDLNESGSDSYWYRSGDTFETLSMTPSVDADVCGHFTLTAGVFN